MKKKYNDIIAALTKNEQRKFYLQIFLNLVISAADILALALLLFTVNFYTQQQSLNYFPALPMWVTDKNSLWLISFFLLFFSLKNLIGYFIQKKQYKFVFDVAARISATNLLIYLNGDFDNYTNIDSAVHIKNTNQQPIEFAQYILSGIQQIFTETMLILFSVIAILLFNASLFLLLFAVLVPGIILMSYLIKVKLKQARLGIKNSGEKSLQHLQEALSGYIESNIYNKHNFFVKRYGEYQQKVNNYLSEMQATQGISSRLMEVFAVMGLFILIVASKLLNIPSSELITLAAFIAAAYKIIPGIVRIVNISGLIKTYQYSIPIPANEKIKHNKDSKNESEIKLCSLSLSNISYSYKEHQVINNISFQIKEGEMIGLSGISGQGKTTLINLILGFLIPDSGKIFINDCELKANEIKDWWKNIAYIKQQPFILNDSIKKNIVLDESNIDWKKLNAAIAATGLTQFIEKFNEGIENTITENGKNISGGQRQRIAIARALYKDADFIILDEPFNELDKTSEQLLLKHFSQLALQGKMILLITHNQDSLSFCHKKFSLDENE